MPEDLDYFHRRAEAQLDLAQKSGSAMVIAAHVAIAERYLEYCEPARRQEAARRGKDARLRPLAPDTDG
ncbi:hypothetical protein [Sphingomonas sp.]|uniref:hypothetical protein n=1 Tax=Sphingomonas sp. TaxID=28214 RepID=UPI002DD6A2F4|nr:hypothetical protein [Sphingomonas sp.]